MRDAPPRYYKPRTERRASPQNTDDRATILQDKSTWLNAKELDTKRNRRTGKIEPEKIFHHAVSFYGAQKVLLRSIDVAIGSPEAQSLMIPTATLSAFTCELFLKCLICIERGYAPDGHNLRDLFDLLSGKTRKRIQDRWDDYAKKYEHRWVERERLTGPIARDLPSALSAGSKAFELLRYMHEEGEGFQFYIGALPDMLVRVAFELRPDWAKAADDALNAASGEKRPTDNDC